MWFSIFRITSPMHWFPKLVIELAVNLAIFGILAAIIAFSVHYGWYYK